MVKSTSVISVAQRCCLLLFFFFNDTATTEIYTLSLHDALPIPHYQAAFRNGPSFAELEELTGLLRDKLQGRPVELVLPTPDDPMNDPELLYFFGGFRSVSGITSPRGSIWTKADRDAWIAKVLTARNACVFFDSRSLDSPLFRAWNDAAKAGAVVTQPIEGRRPYGLLSCK